MDGYDFKKNPHDASPRENLSPQSAQGTQLAGTLTEPEQVDTEEEIAPIPKAVFTMTFLQKEGHPHPSQLAT